METENELGTQDVQEKSQELENQNQSSGLTPGDYDELVKKLRQENAQRRVENKQLKEKAEAAERALADLQAKLAEMELEGAALKQELGLARIEQAALLEIARRGIGKHADILMPAIRERLTGSADVGQDKIAVVIDDILATHPELLGVPGTPKGSRAVVQERAPKALKLTY